MYKLLFLVFICLSYRFQISAQTTENFETYRPKFDYLKSNPSSTNTVVKEDIKPNNDVTADLNEKLDSIASRNKKIKFTQGYRVIVYSGTNKEEVKKIREKVYTIFPDIDIYQIYKQPDYKIKVGDYTNRFEAHQVLNELKKVFPEALIVMEQVNIIRKNSGN